MRCTSNAGEIRLDSPLKAVFSSFTSEGVGAGVSLEHCPRRIQRRIYRGSKVDYLDPGSQEIRFAAGIERQSVQVSHQNILGFDVSVNDSTRVHLSNGL